jgi:hypothetical protein
MPSFGGVTHHGLLPAVAGISPFYRFRRALRASQQSCGVMMMGFAPLSPSYGFLSRKI